MNFKMLSLFMNFVLIIHADSYLFKKYPELKNKIPHISFCDLPTPIQKLENFGDKLNHKNIFIKRDDLTGKKINEQFRFYGGNKPRKLEFLLADALTNNVKTIITYGCAGSNHALATAVYANKLGLKSILMLKDQPNSFVVRHNLLLDKYYEAQLKFCINNIERNAAAQEILKNDQSAYLIPTGGSNQIGVLGFVNAGFELAHQIEAKEMHEPDLIYIAAGSFGTVAGLLLGLKASGINSKIVAVYVEPEDEIDEFLAKIKELFLLTNKFLNSLDSNFGIIEFPSESLIINKKFAGTKYGLFVSEGVYAINMFKNTENIKIEGTYTSRPVAAIIDDVMNANIQDKTILFWNTYCGIDYSNLLDYSDYKKLPKEFHKYFEEEVQVLANE